MPASTTAPTTTASQRRVSIAHTKIIAGCSLIAVPTAALAPSRIGSSSQRQPRTNSRSRIGPTWPSFSE